MKMKLHLSTKRKNVKTMQNKVISKEKIVYNMPHLFPVKLLFPIFLCNNQVVSYLLLKILHHFWQKIQVWLKQFLLLIFILNKPTKQINKMKCKWEYKDTIKWKKEQQQRGPWWNEHSAKIFKQLTTPSNTIADDAPLTWISHTKYHKVPKYIYINTKHKPKKVKPCKHIIGISKKKLAEDKIMCNHKIRVKPTPC